MRMLTLALSLLASTNAIALHSKAFVDVVAQVKPAIVGVGIHAPLATVSNQLQGTGFVVGNGHYVVTNEHVVTTEMEEGIKSQRVIFVPNGQKTIVLPIDDIFVHDQYDLAILKISQPLPAVSLTSVDTYIADGSEIGLTGFPIGAVLGLFPATHKGVVAAKTPNITPAQHSFQLSESFLQRIQQPLMIYQLDITAYPGNSGSPVYLAESGEVFAVINQVFVKDTKESAISDPSGITYAIPISEVYKLAQQHQISL